jgi:aminopeptidase-like protein
MPDLNIHEVPTGTKCFDWEVPEEWGITEAYIEGPDGKKIVDFASNNLHVVGYSIPVDQTLSLEELQTKLHSIEHMPDAIPYVTSYYKDDWGFCISDRQRKSLKPGKYRAFVDSEKKPGHMTYGDLLVSGKSKEEVLISTYICHPSMANNELSGPVVATFLAEWINSFDTQYSYRFVFVPETIGSIYYISENFHHLKDKVIAGFVLTCIGDDRTYSYLPSRKGNTLADRAAKHALKHIFPEFIEYSFLDRGSDERQYCSPGVDLPVASILRSKYHEYDEYHTSLDNLDFVTPSGLLGGLTALKRSIEAIETNKTYRVTHCCEPQLGKRNLYPNLSKAKSYATIEDRMNLLAYSDGTVDLLEIASLLNRPIWELCSEVNVLCDAGLLTEC